MEHLEANGDIQAHAGTFRGMQWHVRNTGEFREIQGDIGENRIIKENKRGLSCAKLSRSWG